jgi:hypothetical protein
LAWKGGLGSSALKLIPQKIELLGQEKLTLFDCPLFFQKSRVGNFCGVSRIFGQTYGFN